MKEQLEGIVEIWQKATYRAGLDIVYSKICEAYKKRASEETAEAWDAIGNAMGIYSQVDAFLDGVPLADVLA